jgi:hypothetical protein
MRIPVFISVEKEKLNYDTIEHGYYRHFMPPRLSRFTVHL